MSCRFRIVVLIALFGSVPAMLRAQVAPYDFVINRQASGLDADLSLTAGTSGTLIGNYDVTNNPTGTRTKPGAFGPFGEMENLPVPTSLSASIGGPAQSSTSGSFHMDLDFANGLLSMSNFSADFLGSGALSLPASVTFEFDTFRTRNPNSLYIGGFPLTVPLGAASLDALTANQSDGGTAGILTSVGLGEYSFLVAPLVTLSGSVSFLGMSLDLPPTPLPLPLQGQITLTDTGAVLTSMQPIQLSNMTEPALTLPQLPFDLPTILPPGDTAHLLLDLMLDQISASFDGTLNLQANGTLVPEPSTIGLLLGASLCLRRRR